MAFEIEKRLSPENSHASILRVWRALNPSKWEPRVPSTYRNYFRAVQICRPADFGCVSQFVQLKPDLQRERTVSWNNQYKLKYIYDVSFTFNSASIYWWLSLLVSLCTTLSTQYGMNSLYSDTFMTTSYISSGDHLIRGEILWNDSMVLSHQHHHKLTHFTIV